jgi:hypothetical protein
MPNWRTCPIFLPAWGQRRLGGNELRRDPGLCRGALPDRTAAGASGYAGGQHPAGVHQFEIYGGGPEGHGRPLLRCRGAASGRDGRPGGHPEKIPDIDHGCPAGRIRAEGLRKGGSGHDQGTQNPLDRKIPGRRPAVFPGDRPGGRDSEAGHERRHGEPRRSGGPSEGRIPGSGGWVCCANQ